MKRSFFYALFLIGSFGCNQKANSIKLKHLGVESYDWKKDTIGCLMYRNKNAESIVKHQNEILKSEKDDIITFFGEPNYIYTTSGKEEVFIYIIEPSILCKQKNNYKNLPRTDAASIFFLFDKEKKLVRIGQKIQ